MKRDVCLLIPAKNESDSISKLLPHIQHVSSRIKEVIIVVDDIFDETLTIQNSITMNAFDIFFCVSGKSGIAAALQAGVKKSSSPNIVICMADELLPLLKLEQFVAKLDEGFGLVSATRYSLGGKRYGGSWVGRSISRIANLILFHVFRFGLRDSTTGMKAFQKQYWEKLSIDIDYGGWAAALAVTRNAKKFKIRVAEIPIISVDRIFGGKSKFILRAWALEYLRALK